MKLIQACFPFMLLVSTITFAADNTHYNRISLNASASETVENDTFVVIMYAQSESKNMSIATNEVNTRIKSALKYLGQEDLIKVFTLNYQTAPIYNKRVLERWRVRQSIRLESQNTKKLSEITGELQKHLATASMQYVLSSEAKKKVEKRLIIQAINNFNQRAKLIASQFSDHKHKLVTMNITTPASYLNQHGGQVMAMERSPGFTAPSITPGEQVIQISINGTIELVLSHQDEHESP